jgi:hypothetical protein
MEINVREYRRGNLRWEIQRKRTIEGTQDTDKQTKTHHKCVGHHHAQANTVY